MATLVITAPLSNESSAAERPWYANSASATIDDVLLTATERKASAKREPLQGQLTLFLFSFSLLSYNMDQGSIIKSKIKL
jgi:hypothetical protein